MFKIKHLLDSVEADDGTRLWVEPIGLTRDLRQWASVDCLATHLGPPMGLWQWFQEHPDGYEYFRAMYHENLGAGPHRTALQELCSAAQARNITLLHQGDNPTRNTATALYEFLSELSSYCPPE